MQILAQTVRVVVPREASWETLVELCCDDHFWGGRLDNPATPPPLSPEQPQRDLAALQPRALTSPQEDEGQRGGQGAKRSGKQAVLQHLKEHLESMEVLQAGDDSVLEAIIKEKEAAEEAAEHFKCLVAGADEELTDREKEMEKMEVEMENLRENTEENKRKLNEVETSATHLAGTEEGMKRAREIRVECSKVLKESIWLQMK